ncbi:hypothetical protein DNJ95_06850 [Stutzerimonas kirkiae]|uniref:Uncharacterized protein n=1 Tax=Stutzerimonas kirkiae TaxID=2211392 RepID=A0A4V2KD23_9GAMM|nr:hypothetical protein DNJ96_09200 [Stutzerimonas kirkiae]TBV03667.1 hypothetical protein DNJ95_06850 [Stutzerimonas kirkiae]TBV11339.1 hypothetical protein DNK08_03550 [Stutzerimonas kirkiae]TBV12457.1 hypothetical protein DNK01_14645 [Stutzerimonas kirkiae]
MSLLNQIFQIVLYCTVHDLDSGFIQAVRAGLTNGIRPAPGPTAPLSLTLYVAGIAGDQAARLPLQQHQRTLQVDAQGFYFHHGAMPDLTRQAGWQMMLGDTHTLADMESVYCHCPPSTGYRWNRGYRPETHGQPGALVAKYDRMAAALSGPEETG